MVGVRKYLDNHSDDIQNCWRPADPEASILSLPSGRNKRAKRHFMVRPYYMALADKDGKSYFLTKLTFPKPFKILLLIKTENSQMKEENLNTDQPKFHQHKATRQVLLSIINQRCHAMRRMTTFRLENLRNIKMWAFDRNLVHCNNLFFFHCCVFGTQTHLRPCTRILSLTLVLRMQNLQSGLTTSQGP